MLFQDEAQAETLAQRINFRLNEREHREGVVHDVLDETHRSACRQCRQEFLRIP